MNVIDGTLIDFQRRRSDVDSNTGSYNIVDALVVAAFDGRIHLECVDLLLRREPDVLQKPIPSSSITTAITAVMNASNNTNDNGNIDEDTDSLIGTTKINPKKC